VTPCRGLSQLPYWLQARILAIYDTFVAVQLDFNTSHHRVTFLTEWLIFAVLWFLQTCSDSDRPSTSALRCFGYIPECRKPRGILEPNSALDEALPVIPSVPLLTAATRRSGYD
jgi:hypothetical protein